MIITKTPLRIPLGGGGTDLPFYYTRSNGSVITAAIDKYIYVIVGERKFENEIILKYSKVETLRDIEKIEHPIIREALKLLGIREPIEITSMADVSAGTGLGSSGSFAVGLLNALYAYRGEYVSARRLAEDVCKLIMDIIKDPAGKQDPYIAAFGGITHLDINKKGKVIVSPINISFDTIKNLENNIFLFYTGIKRSAAEVLKSQEKAVESDKEKMNNLTKIKEIGGEIRKCLEKGNTAKFGKWLDVHWKLKQTLSNKMSNPQITNWYDLAIRNGALGGKIMGAGGGGFFMFYCENNQQIFVSNMERAGLKRLPFRFDFDGSRIVFQGR